MYAFHVTVPPGATSLDVAFDFIAAPETGGFSSGGSTTTELAVMNWNQLLLYPQGTPPEQLRYQANLRIPELMALRHGAYRLHANPATRSNFNPRRWTR